MSIVTDRLWPAGLPALITLMALVFAIFPGCDEDATFKPGDQNPGIRLSPDSTAVSTGGRVAFAATITGLASRNVSWYVNGSLGGDAVYGTITKTGVYTAPRFLPEEPLIMVKVVSLADTTYFAETPVLILKTVKVEMEDYVSVLFDSGTDVNITSCSGASGAKAVEGFDVVGDVLAFQVSFDNTGYYSAVLRGAALKGASSEITITVIHAGPGGEDQVASFSIEGKGIT